MKPTDTRGRGFYLRASERPSTEPAQPLASPATAALPGRQAGRVGGGTCQAAGTSVCTPRLTSVLSCLSPGQGVWSELGPPFYANALPFPALHFPSAELLHVHFICQCLYGLKVLKSMHRVPC